MNTCSRCGNEFDLTHAKRRVGRSYGAGIYDHCFPDGDVCEKCAEEEISADYGVGCELKEDMGSGWDDD